MTDDDIKLINALAEGNLELADTLLKTMKDTDIIKTDSTGFSVALVSLWMLQKETDTVFEKLTEISHTAKGSTNNHIDPKVARDHFIREKIVPKVHNQLRTFLKNLANTVSDLEIVASNRSKFFIECADAVLNMFANDKNLSESYQDIAASMFMRIRNVANAASVLTFNYSARISPTCLKTALPSIAEEEGDSDEDLDHADPQTPPPLIKKGGFLGK